MQRAESKDENPLAITVRAVPIANSRTNVATTTSRIVKPDFLPRPVRTICMLKLVSDQTDSRLGKSPMITGLSALGPTRPTIYHKVRGRQLVRASKKNRFFLRASASL